MADRWHYKLMGEEYGPVSVQEMAKLIADGLVDRDSLIRREGESQWATADKYISAFEKHYSPVVTPPTSPTKHVAPVQQSECQTDLVDYSRGRESHLATQFLQSFLIVNGFLAGFAAVIGTLDLITGGGDSISLVVFGSASCVSSLLASAILSLIRSIDRNTYTTMKASVETANLLRRIAEHRK